MSMFLEPAEREARQKWLDSLKAGDRVAIQSSNTGSSSYSIATLKRVHRGKRSRFDTEHQSFNADGSWSQGYHWEEIGPITDDVREYIKQRRLLTAIGGYNWKAATIEVLERVATAIGRWPPQKPAARELLDPAAGPVQPAQERGKDKGEG